MPLNADIEQNIHRLGDVILREARHRRRASQQHREAFLNRLLSDSALKTQVLRLVDVLPSLTHDRQLAEHLDIYLGSQELPIPWPRLAKWGLHKARKGAAAHLIAAAARRLSRKMAMSFIAGETVDQVEPVLRRIWRNGMDFSLDILGEASTGESTATAYQDSYLKLIPELNRRIRTWAVRNAPGGNQKEPRVHVSVKLSALYSQIRPADPDGSVKVIKDRLRRIVSAAALAEASVTVDMEQYDYRTITLRVFQELLEEKEFREFRGAGIAVQAYQIDAMQIVTNLISWAKVRGTPVTIRLVRGAYWDYERAVAMQHSWPVPVWETKAQTDACYEQCLEQLLNNHPFVRTAIATHNLRSICAGAAIARAKGLAVEDFEFQMLYGMADDLAASLVDRHFTVRLYAPMGPLLPGMAYLVRRLMENSSNESFLKRAYTDLPADQILFPPDLRPANSSPPPPKGDDGFTHLPPLRPAITSQYSAFAEALDQVRAAEPVGVYPVINHKEMIRPATGESVNPSRPDRIVGRISNAQVQDVHSAVAASVEAGARWRCTPPRERAALLDKAAGVLARRRHELAAWEIVEAGKPWMEADADVCEAVDHIRYAAFGAMRFLASRNMDVSGESNTYTYHGIGPAAIIAPWNFPLAIPAGMAAAALAAGNPVLIKPAPQTPVTAWWLWQALLEAGFPAGTIGFLPGGDDIGRALVEHPDVALIAFTGSEATGRRIISAAAAPDRCHFKRVIAEMGGKNAIIVDDDANLDDAIPDIIASAFSYAGQKCSACSRLIVLENVYDSLMGKLMDAAASLRIGDAADSSTFVGPVIDQPARDRIALAVEQAKSEAHLVFQATVPRNLDGFYIPPTIFADVNPDSMLAQEEIFGPVLAVFRVKNIDQAVTLANNSRYGLTGGIMSRNPRTIDFVRHTMAVGNLYINRRITGAVVNRQPFGGAKLSGLGSKAGGPDYLLQFAQAKVVTENTIRRGFVPPQP